MQTIQTIQTVQAANGAEFAIVKADSYTARMARGIHPVTMADGTVWMAGAGRPGTPIAWQPNTRPAPRRTTAN